MALCHRLPFGGANKVAKLMKEKSFVEEMREGRLDIYRRSGELESAADSLADSSSELITI